MVAFQLHVHTSHVKLCTLVGTPLPCALCSRDLAQADRRGPFSLLPPSQRDLGEFPRRPHRGPLYDVTYGDLTQRGHVVYCMRLYAPFVVRPCTVRGLCTHFYGPMVVRFSHGSALFKQLFIHHSTGYVMPKCNLCLKIITGVVPAWIFPIFGTSGSPSRACSYCCL